MSAKFLASTSLTTALTFNVATIGKSTTRVKANLLPNLSIGVRDNGRDREAVCKCKPFAPIAVEVPEMFESGIAPLPVPKSAKSITISPGRNALISLVPVACSGFGNVANLYTPLVTAS